MSNSGLRDTPALRRLRGTVRGPAAETEAGRRPSPGAARGGPYLASLARRTPENCQAASAGKKFR